jgi:beta-glucosidase
VTAIEELGIARFRITNGPVGVGMGDGIPSSPATSLPMIIGRDAGFDPDLAHAYGDIIGSDCDAGPAGARGPRTRRRLILGQIGSA